MSTKSKRPKLTDQIRQAVKDCGLTQYRICKETNLDAATLSRFVSGGHGLSMESLDTLAAFLNLSIRSGRKPTQRK